MKRKFSFKATLIGAFCVGSFGMAFAAPLADGASKFLGNITTNGSVRSDFGDYWNQITAENECKWGSVEGTRDVMNFTGCDNVYNYAKSAGIPFKFHTLVWGSQYPKWMDNLSSSEQLEEVTEWFDAVAARYPDIAIIDVVNEAITGHAPAPFKDALGGDGTSGYDWIVKSFKMARERWPEAILVYNDYNTFRWQINEGIALVKAIKNAGAPIDAYGQQSHDLTEMEYSEFKTALNKIHDETGLPLYITEYDIGTDDDALQKQRYQEQITEFWNSDFVAGITLWGYIYGSTWTTNGNSGIIKNGSDRPAMTWLKEFMAQNKGENTTGLGEGSTIDTVAQAPYADTLRIPGKIEAENYDVGGQTQSYYDSDAANQGGKYREDRVDIVQIDSTDATKGYAIGYTNAGEWLEYTVNIEKASAYRYEIAAASGSDNSSVRLFLDDEAVTDTIAITNGGDWSTYSTISGTTATLSAGTHVLKLAITGAYANIDNIVFKDLSDTITTSIGNRLERKANGLSEKRIRIDGQKSFIERNGKRFDLLGNRIRK